MMNKFLITMAKLTTALSVLWMWWGAWKIALFYLGPIPTAIQLPINVAYVCGSLIPFALLGLSYLNESDG